MLLLVALPGCYHMRTDAEPIAPGTIIVLMQPGDAVQRIRTRIEEKWNCRILETDSSGTVLLTAPYHFATDTGFGQPAGGRKYYTQLRVEVSPAEKGAMVRIAPRNLEIRSTYAYNNYAGGSKDVGTLHKHYPYEEYPGMFDLELISKEIDRATSDISRLFREYK